MKTGVHAQSGYLEAHRQPHPRSPVSLEAHEEVDEGRCEGREELEEEGEEQEEEGDMKEELEEEQRTDGRGRVAAGECFSSSQGLPDCR